MLRESLNRRGQIALVLFLVGLLVAIRAFEEQLFYDPFTAYFQSDFSQSLYPDCSKLLLFGHWILRYMLNSVVTVSLVYVVFKKKDMAVFSAVLLGVFLIVLLVLLYLLLNYLDESHKMILFYVRRFVIQPLFLLLFIPAFYYQKRNS
ncbi:exosortase F system-associated protein [Flavobacterium amniphilum]|uniref:exosortase F system-associated membrane protein n=1 Tax=Flavobacterium amniphilum TaxID=1834035 RepID=UPI00202A214D|nr:exosortase F system-associated protein [Flavobacterium amniphilum]MCL9804690.1 exosortase F system-associated protein [Flavobacterium amniphilum]